MYLLFIVPILFLDQTRLIPLGKRLIIATVITGVIFLLFPSQLGFERVVPELPVFRSIFNVIFSIDLPYNIAPSLHVIFSSSILRTKIVWQVWLIVICVSTVLVHQHYIVDIVSALLIVWIIRRVIR